MFLRAISRLRSIRKQKSGVTSNPDSDSGINASNNNDYSQSNPQDHNHNQYAYAQLPEGCIRLLQLDPGSGEEEPVTCRLLTVSFGSAPQYIAISYVWGGPHNTVHVKCDDSYLRVTVNLRDALLRFRNPNQSRLLWADAICINQSDDDEKSQQVSIMGLIYYNAQRVNVWLGHIDAGPTGTAAALQSMAAAVGLYRDDIKKYGSRVLVPQYKSDDLLAVDGAENIQHSDWQGWLHSSGWIGHEGWEALRQLFDKPWFSRAWIVQEVGLAKDAWFFFGTSGTLAVRLKELTEFMDWLFHSSRIIAQYFEFDTRLYDLMQSYRQAVHREPEARHNLNSSTFLDVLDRARGFQCSNKLDIVYAYLGHPSAIKSPQNTVNSRGSDYASCLLTNSTIVTPRYGGHTEMDLFFELAINVLENWKVGLDILLYVAHENEESLYGVNLPSWVPRWDLSGVPRCFGSPQKAHYKASGDLMPGTIKILDHHYLKLKALSLGTVIFQWVFPEPCWFVTWSSRHKSFKNTASDEEISPVEHLSIAFTNIRHTLPAGTSHLNDTVSFATTLTAGLTGDGILVSDMEAHYANFCAYRLAKAAIWGPEILPEVHGVLERHAVDGNSDQYFCDVQKACANRAFFCTEDGNIGLGPRVMTDGDELWLPLGSRVPYILRPTYGKYGDCYRVLGQAYVHGFMEGETVRELQEDTFQEILLC